MTTLLWTKLENCNSGAVDTRIGEQSIIARMYNHLIHKADFPLASDMRRWCNDLPKPSLVQQKSHSCAKPRQHALDKKYCHLQEPQRDPPFSLSTCIRQPGLFPPANHLPSSTYQPLNKLPQPYLPPLNKIHQTPFLLSPLSPITTPKQLTRLLPP